MTDDVHTEAYRACRLCPNLCGVDRLDGEPGLCGEGEQLRIAFAGIHRGEEPCISVTDRGFSGSGTIFFTGCTLGCRDCQNVQISRDHLGAAVSVEEFSRICLELQHRGAANINLVTGTQFIPSIAAGLRMAKADGLILPVIWNTSSFETVEALGLIDDLIDIYLADIKSLDAQLNRDSCGHPSYGAVAVQAIEFMTERHQLEWDGQVLLSGVIVRHLVLPGYLEQTAEVLRWFSEHTAAAAVLSLMVQYIPMDREGWIDAVVTESCYEQLLELLDEVGIEDGFIQELGDEEPWVPDFSARNPFPDSFCDPVWHWSCSWIDR
jgi:putative pyruvate formate lyase activating enzyme